jgi:hypothetical protein
MEAQAATQEHFATSISNPPTTTEPVESKEQAFVRLGEKRMDRALKVIEQIGNLSNRASYDYQPEDVEAIGSALQTALDAALARFRPRAQREGFKLR